MGKRQNLKVIFKQNDQYQMMLLPPSLDDLVALDHPVRVVNAVLDKTDKSGPIEGYKPGGASSHHPRMLLKSLVYAYINSIFHNRVLSNPFQVIIF